MSRTPRAPDWGLTPRELSFLRNLDPPWRIQRFLDSIEYDLHAEGCRSPRRVIRERKAQCMDGALFAAAALRAQGHPPLLVDLDAVRDDAHVIAVFRRDGGWGAIARSNFSGLRYREPVYPDLRTLVFSYFEPYFNLARERTLRSYSRPIHLRRFDRRGWMTAPDDLWDIARAMPEFPHRPLLPPGRTARFSRVDRRSFEAGLIGRRSG